ncbi:PDR/VanB family oxidoreductase [Bradyrhizobium prioriisuperbiae]|uniref:PDR/VanB family oxidoreductase n=1 Tax=Bradyrhizobium prioriisuperbiae TaxID=2854389 RepID=UPI0028E4C5DE|nr:PDR/VanB family oxidoreductase [Bradyrhizobium prioritasuperba]
MSKTAITTIKTVVVRIDDVGVDTKAFVLEDPDQWELPPHHHGAHIDLHLPGKIVRTYSLCNDPAERTRYVVAVKREAEGRGGSLLLHDRVSVGDVIGVTLPRGGLRLAEHASRLICVAGGIGVTPFLSSVMSRQADCRLHLICRDQVPFLDQLAPLIRRERVIVHRTVLSGRPDIAALLGRPQPGIAVACCGPDSLIADFEHAAQEWPDERKHIEHFVPPPLPVDPNAKPYTLVLARSGCDIVVEAGQTMLSALQQAEIDIPASCCGGICGSCKVTWLEGQPVHRDRILSPAERERHLMVCVAGSASERLVLEL